MSIEIPDGSKRIESAEKAEFIAHAGHGDRSEAALERERGQIENAQETDNYAENLESQAEIEFDIRKRAQNMTEDEIDAEVENIKRLLKEVDKSPQSDKSKLGAEFRVWNKVAMEKLLYGEIKI